MKGAIRLIATISRELLHELPVALGTPGDGHEDQRGPRGEDDPAPARERHRGEGVAAHVRHVGHHSLRARRREREREMKKNKLNLPVPLFRPA